MCVLVIRDKDNEGAYRIHARVAGYRFGGCDAVRRHRSRSDDVTFGFARRHAAFLGGIVLRPVPAGRF